MVNCGSLIPLVNKFEISLKIQHRFEMTQDWTINTTLCASLHS